ncbi:MAG: IS66 family insertion sequence element accessory protein TnpB [Gammaproteobacteria bacterium]|jgi:transposase
MFFPEGSVRIFLHERPVDMRKSFDGLYALVKHVLGEDPLCGGLFVFVNRRGNYLKALYFDRTGFCIWAKRLERGVFLRRHSGGLKRSMSYTDLKLLLEGIEASEVRRRQRFSMLTSA